MSKKEKILDVQKRIKDMTTDELQTKTEEMTEGMLKSNILYRVFSGASILSLISVAAGGVLAFSSCFLPSIITLTSGTAGFVISEKMKYKFGLKACQYGETTEKMMEELLERMPDGPKAEEIFTDMA